MVNGFQTRDHHPCPAALFINSPSQKKGSSDGRTCCPLCLSDPALSPSIPPSMFSYFYDQEGWIRCGVGSPRIFFHFFYRSLTFCGFPLFLTLALSEHSGSLWLTLAHSGSLPGSLWLSLLLFEALIGTRAQSLSCYDDQCQV